MQHSRLNLLFMKLFLLGLLALPGMVWAQSWSCQNVANVDFGDCGTPLGFANVNGQCALVSGCMSHAGGVDYAAAIHGTVIECERACNPDACVSEALLSTGIIVECEAVLDPVCGCDGVTYDNACMAEWWFGLLDWEPGPCPVPGCTYPSSSNYNPAATLDDGSCDQMCFYTPCFGDLNEDGVRGTADLMLFLSVFGLPCE